MKATVDPGLMKTALKQISPVIGKNVVVPITECVKMDFDGTKLVMTGTNFRNQVTVTTTCDNKKPFTVIMPMDKFQSIVGKADTQITIELTDKQIKVQHDNAKFNLPISGQPHEFPVMTPDEYVLSYKADGDFFHSIRGANESGSKAQHEVQILNAVIDFKKDGITIFGTDRVVVYKKDIPFKTKTPISAHITQNFVELTKTFQESEIQVCEKFISATYQNVSVTSRLSENRYVDYTVMNPKVPIVFNVLVNRKDLIKEIERLDIAANQKTKDIIFTFNNPGQMDMEAYDNDYGLSGQTFLPCSHEVMEGVGPIRISGDRTLALLNCLSDVDIKMSFTDPKAFVYIQPDEDDTTLLFTAPIALI